MTDHKRTWRNPTKWSDENLQLLEHYCKNTKLSAREIGLLIGVTKNAVIGMANRRRWPLGRARERGFFTPTEKPIKPKVKIEAIPEEDLDRPWRCRGPGCGGTRQPGRDFCATCLNGHIQLRKEA